VIALILFAEVVAETFDVRTRRKGGLLERAHQFEHGVAPAASDSTDLRRRKMRPAVTAMALIKLASAEAAVSVTQT
jgi:hypothetical protein